MTGAGAEISPCPPAARAEVLHVLYRRAPEGLRPHLVAEALEEAAGGRLDLSGLWRARRRGRVVGALLTQALGGRAAAVWAPEVATLWKRAELAAALVGAVLDDLRRRGVLVAQALVDDAAPRCAAADLTRGGLPRVTELTYLGRDADAPLEVGPGVPAMGWQPYGPATDAAFRAVLARTYLGSLDMPELEGVRSLDDILAGHRAAGHFDPTAWQLGRLPGEPAAAAVLLLAEHRERDAWEVTYLGLTPEARGRGLGRAALAHALAQARPHAARVELAVDVRNRPAERLYRAAGFTPFDRRAVHLATLRAGPGPAPLRPSRPGESPRGG